MINQISTKTRLGWISAFENQGGIKLKKKNLVFEKNWQ